MVARNHAQRPTSARAGTCNRIVTPPQREHWPDAIHDQTNHVTSNQTQHTQKQPIVQRGTLVEVVVGLAVVTVRRRLIAHVTGLSQHLMWAVVPFQELVVESSPVDWFNQNPVACIEVLVMTSLVVSSCH